MEQDLGGDALKVVRYRVLFTKPGVEAVLQEGEEMISYPTDVGSWTGRRLSDFLVQVKQGLVPRPAAWRQAGYAAPAVGQHEHEWAIPEGDHKYLTCHCEVLDRYPAAEDGVEKDRLEALTEIRKAVEGNRPRVAGE